MFEIVRGDMAEGEARLKTGAPPMMNLFSHRRNRKGLLILTLQYFIYMWHPFQKYCKAHSNDLCSQF